MIKGTRLLRTFSLLSALGLTLALGAGCQQEKEEGPMEKLGKQIDQDARKLEEKAKEAGEELGDSFEELGDDIEEATDE